jgi:hypothetical protein
VPQLGHNVHLDGMQPGRDADCQVRVTAVLPQKPAAHGGDSCLDLLVRQYLAQAVDRRRCRRPQQQVPVATGARGDVRGFQPVRLKDAEGGDDHGRRRLAQARRPAL